MEQTIVTTKQKVWKISKIVLTVIFYLFIALMLLFSIATLGTKTKRDIPNLFGKGMLAVASDSMEGSKPDSFKKGDLIFVKVLTEEAKQTLEPDQIITFYDHEKKALNTHRILNVNKDSEGKVTSFDTYRDKDNGKDDTDRLLVDVVGLYQGSRLKGFGNVISFMQSQLGFALIVIVPVIIMLAWNGYLLMKNVFVIKKEKMMEENESEKERMRAELLEQLRQEQESKSVEVENKPKE